MGILQLLILLKLLEKYGLKLQEILLHHMLPDLDHIDKVETVHYRTLLDIGQANQLSIILFCNIKHGLQKMP